ncbi:archease [Candidatus Woesearchaeota archaeon]|nr:archease [Candidatus Woesearchaeota archaeon]
MSKSLKYEYLPHTADVKFLAYGKTLEEAFSNAAVAMFNVMVETAKVKPKTAKKIAAEGADLESLLQNFLEQFIILLDTDNFFLSKIKKIEIRKSSSKYSLNAVATGDEAKNYETIGPQVKACTYNSMLVQQKGKAWMVQVVVDI